MTVEKGLRLDQVQDLKYQMDNLLVNGNFNIWQRGTTFTAAYPFTADEWKVICTAVGTYSRSTTDPKVGDYCFRVNSVVLAGSSLSLRQGIENYKSLEGLTLTLSVWVKTTVGGQFRAYIRDYDGTVQSAFSDAHTGSGLWERLTVVKPIRTGLTNPADLVNFPHNFPLIIDVINCGPVVGTVTDVYVDGATLVVGNYPEGVPFVPETGYDEIVRCMRYYQRYSSYQMDLYSIGGSGMVVGNPLPVMMYGTAVVTHITDGLTGNATALTLQYNAGACQSFENILNINPTGVGGCNAEFTLEVP